MSYKKYSGIAVADVGVRASGSGGALGGKPAVVNVDEVEPAVVVVFGAVEPAVVVLGAAEPAVVVRCWRRGLC